MGFNTIKIHCNILCGVKDKSNDTKKLYTFNLIELAGYMMNIIQNTILYQKVTKDRIECIKDEYGRPIDFNVYVLSF